jgi:predicted nucleic acid-binding protein
VNPVFADTFFYLALLDERDPAHQRALAAAKVNRPVITTEFIVLEIADGCARAEDHADFLALLEGMRRNSRLEIAPLSSELMQDGIDFYARHSDKDWSLTDRISLVVMRNKGIEEALTADHNFEQAGFRILLS